MSQMPGSPMGGDFGPIFGGPFGGRMRRMPFPPINRGTIFRPGRPRPPIYSPGGPNKGGTQAPIPRFPSRGSGASNFYRSPMYNPGVPSGLSALLSGRPSPFGRMTDPATGFPQRTSGKGGGSKGSARTVKPSEQEPVMDRQPQPDIGMNPFPGGYDDDRTRSSQIPRDILDRGTVMNPVYRSQGPESLMGRVDSGLRFGEPAISRVESQGPESLMRKGRAPSPEEIRQSPRVQAMQMGQTGGRPNIRPTMNVGKATGGPVGIHSGIAALVGRR